MRITAIVDGDEVAVDADPSDDFGAVRLRALVAYGSTSTRPLADWEIRDARGAWIDARTLVRDLPSAGLIYLGFSVGAGA